MSEFVADGLERGERVAYYPRHTNLATLATWLGRRDMDALVASGQLVVGGAEATYFGDGDFDGQARAAAFAAFAEQTMADGYPGLRVYADNGWMAAALPHPVEWLIYELRIGLMVPSYPLIGLCGFDAEDDQPLSPRVIDAVHEVNVGETDDRPSAFHLRHAGHGLALGGELDRSSIEELAVVLDAAKQLLSTTSMSLGDVRFADGASAEALFQFVTENRPTLVDVSPSLLKVWQLLNLRPTPRLA